MMTSQISALHHPTLIDQTDRDPHRDRDEAGARHRQHTEPRHPLQPPTPADAPAALNNEPKTIGLLLDVKA